LPGVGQVLNNTPMRGLTMLFFMLMLGVITFNLAGPEISVVGKFAGGIFVYAISVMDAYYWARYRWERHRFSA
jgi:membrane protein implicated in regulation of membrane protease activity